MFTFLTFFDDFDDFRAPPKNNDDDMYTWCIVYAQSLGSSVAASQYEIIANNGCDIR